MPDPLIAAIICTYNRAEILPRCLESLSKQNLPIDEYEVVIVDNNSTDNTREIIAGFCARNRNFRYVFEPCQGLAIARNTGISNSSALLLSFTDDDAVVPEDWLYRKYSVFRYLPGTTAALGGEIKPIWPGKKPDWLTPKMLHLLSAHLGWSKRPRFLQGDEWLCEVNTTYAREILLKYGGFPEKLGRVGENLLSGENIVNKLMQDDGAQFYFDPDNVVQHHIDKSRLNMSWIRKRSFWQGVTGYYCDQYLRENAKDQSNSHAEKILDLPCSADAWSTMFDETQDNNVNESLTTLWSVGYALASQGVVTGQ